MDVRVCVRACVHACMRVCGCAGVREGLRSCVITPIRHKRIYVHKNISSYVHTYIRTDGGT